MQKVIKKIYDANKDNITNFNSYWHKWECHNRLVNLENNTVSFDLIKNDKITYEIKDPNAIVDSMCWEMSDEEKMLEDILLKHIKSLEDEIKVVKENLKNFHMSIFAQTGEDIKNFNYSNKGWDCAQSPIGKCAYKGPSNNECCVFCKEPKERK